MLKFSNENFDFVEDNILCNGKSNEPLELIDGLPPRKVMIDRMRKIISTINIETLLKQTEIDFLNENPLDSLFPLEFFEDKDFDIFTAEE